MIRGVMFCTILFISMLTLSAKDNKQYVDTPPMESIIINKYDEGVVKSHLDNSPLSKMEGIWHYSDENMRIVIEKLDSQAFSTRFKYRLVLLSSDDKSLIPGTIVGYIMDSAIQNKFYLWMYSERIGSVLYHPQKCVAEISDNFNEITFSEPELKVRLRVNFSRFLPTIFRGIGITAEKQIEKLKHGLIRLYPHGELNGLLPSELIYL